MSEEKIRNILQELKNLASRNGDGSFGDLNEAMNDIDSILSADNLSSKHFQIKVLIAPTANLQDLAIDCGWGKKFLKLADELDELIKDDT